MSLVGIVSNTSKDMVGLPWDLQCDTPVTLSPNNKVTCSAFLFNSSTGKDHCSRCHLPTSDVSPAEVGASLPGCYLAPWKSLLAGKIGSCAGACSWIQLLSMVLFYKMGAVSELLGCSQKFGGVAVPPLQPAGELCCLARPVPAWISGSHAWLS